MLMCDVTESQLMLMWTAYVNVWCYWITAYVNVWCYNHWIELMLMCDVTESLIEQLMLMCDVTESLNWTAYVNVWCYWITELNSLC